MIRSRLGVELELLAPAGSSRAVLAADLARRVGGEVQAVWHTDSEPSLVPGMGRFLHLTKGFAVHGPDGDVVATLVDDITLRDGLDPGATAPTGWLRVLSDDARLLGLVAAHCDPAAPLPDVLAPLAAVFGVRPTARGRAVVVADEGGRTVALAAPAGGERERPCEVVTPVLERDHGARLEALLAPARELGFVVPVEAAVHLHLDAGPFRTPRALANVVRLFAHHRDDLGAALATNPACRRVAPLPAALVALADRVDPATTWDRLAAEALATGVSKFHDVNVARLLRPPGAPGTKDTLEVRVLPGTLDAGEVVRRASLVEELLDRCREDRVLPGPEEVRSAADEPALGRLRRVAHEGTRAA